MFKITKNKCKLLWCLIVTIAIVSGDDTGIEEPVKELCPCLPREVCPHNHALSPLVSKCDIFINFLLFVMSKYCWK